MVGVGRGIWASGEGRLLTLSTKRLLVGWAFGCFVAGVGRANSHEGRLVGRLEWRICFRDNGENIMKGDHIWMTK